VKGQRRHLVVPPKDNSKLPIVFHIRTAEASLARSGRGAGGPLPGKDPRRKEWP
jgi:hypothetical protein